MSAWSDQNQIFLNLPVDQLLAITAYGEAASDGASGMLAVLNVIQNRATNPSQFADQIILALTGSIFHAVILKQWQFSMYNLNDPVRPKAEAWAANFQGYASGNSVFNQAWQLAQSLLSGQLSNNVGNADFYYATTIPKPTWANMMAFIGTVGTQRFYSDGSTIPSKIPTILASYQVAPAPSETAVAATTEEAAPQEASILPDLSSMIPDMGTVDLSSVGLGDVPVTTLLLVGAGLAMLMILGTKKRR